MCLAVPARIVSIQGEMAVVEIGGVARSISLALTPDAQMGQYVILHAGFALNVLDEAEAQETLRLFARMEELAAAEREENSPPQARNTGEVRRRVPRPAALAGGLLERIAQRSTRAVRLMEFCGGHTHAILQHGLRQLLPPTVTLRSGPGCPVCVTSAHDLDVAIALAGVPGAILATFGDMVRVPGSRESLHDARARGADVRVVYSPLDALTPGRGAPRPPGDLSGRRL